jgi:hypothetical protein
VLAEIAEAQELYLVFVTIIILLVSMYVLQRWWTTYR